MNRVLLPNRCMILATLLTAAIGLAGCMPQAGPAALRTSSTTTPSAGDVEAGSGLDGVSDPEAGSRLPDGLDFPIDLPANDDPTAGDALDDDPQPGKTETE